MERGNTVQARTASSAPEPHPHFVLMSQEASNFRVPGLIKEAYTPPKQVSVPHSEITTPLETNQNTPIFSSIVAPVAEYMQMELYHAIH